MFLHFSHQPAKQDAPEGAVLVLAWHRLARNHASSSPAARTRWGAQMALPAVTPPASLNCELGTPPPPPWLSGLLISESPHSAVLVLHRSSEGHRNQFRASLTVLRWETCFLTHGLTRSPQQKGSSVHRRPKA